MGGIGSIALPQAGWAACNDSGTPGPAAPPPTTNFSDSSFGANPPLTPFTLGAPGEEGCVGADGGRGLESNPGGPGIVGQPGGTFTSTNTNLTIYPGFFDGGATLGAVVDVGGGQGGAGGNSGYVYDNLSDGGPGAAGGAGGQVTVQFNNTTVTLDPGNGAASGIGLQVGADGGNGGRAGSTGLDGTAARSGGNGGAGAPAGQASLTASGSVVARQGMQATAIGGFGGQGGGAQTSDAFAGLFGGKGGEGGTGGTATAIWQSGTITGTSFGGVAASANGGDGGNGGATGPSSETHGGNGGAGGQGGTASAQVAPDGKVILNTGNPDARFVAAIYAGANGGSGGNGGTTSALGAVGGSGGNGGPGGTASATVLGATTFNSAAAQGVPNGIGVLVQANGGLGGLGADTDAVFGSAGGGGFAGAGGSATLTLGNADSAGSIQTTGLYAHGALVQSVGGAGGNGGNAKLSSSGGAGAPGGNGGAAAASIVNGRIVVTGQDSAGLIVQSVGGGGGSGGDAHDIDIGAQIAIGGNGGLGGSGSQVTVNLGAGAIVSSLNPLGNIGVLAQSVGGSGGAGGSATSTGVGILSYTIGGDAGAGAPSGPVTVTSAGLVTTFGDHATGIQAQSVGGGGGDGGAGVSNIASLTPTAAVAIGGRGGGGGGGGDAGVTVTADGQVSTYGADAYGIAAQSVGGGGGTGGIAAARAVSFSPDQRIPAVSIAVSLGGKGGTGNTGGQASVTNGGVVTTAGEGSYALFAQSVGGGGGAGGDSTSVAYSGGNSQTGVSVSAAVAIGGSGGSGGLGGAANLANSGLVLTLGTDSVGMFGQSVGGGGGAGGTGDATAASNEGGEKQVKASVGVAIAVGGTGGTGGHGGAVTLDNTGGVITRGDGAHGFFAQSVGGGGGMAGGGVGTAAGDKLSVAVGVGGSGGAGGDGGAVVATNEGAIVTRGVDAVGMMAQSVGGGGGAAGKGGATSGGVDDISKSQLLFDTFAAGLNVGAKVQDFGDTVFKVETYNQILVKQAEELSSVFQQLPGDNTSTVVKNLDLSVAVGGQGGAAGTGGTVRLTNSGQISTYGAQSDGIYAQSVGGGGGKGGAASSSGSSYDDTRNQIAIGVSGGGGNAGDGGGVTATNAAGGQITTRGVLAFGIMGQSIGGGGGTASNTQDVNGSLRSLAIGFNGKGGAQGKGGSVTIENDGSIVTQGKNGIAIVAQSIGGGGGVVKSMTSDMTFDPSKLIDNPQGRALDVQGFSMSFGGGTNSQGDGGPVQVTNSGGIQTALRGAHGILAQSIGGGGGLTVGGQLLGGCVNAANTSVCGDGQANTNNGNAGPVTVTLKDGASIATQGDGAYGILAQSIGGGGGIAGDLSNIGASTTTLGGGVIVAGTGNGGNIGVSLTGAKVTTAGNNAPAIFAQSLGGGGGLLASGNTLQAGGAGGTGTGGGTVSVTLTNATVSTTGALGSPAIAVQNSNTGAAGGSSIVTVDAQSTVSGGQYAAGSSLQGAIVYLGPDGNVLNNAGTVKGIGNTAQYPAIAVNAGAGRVTINNTGTISGSIIGTAAGSVVNNAPGAVLDPGERIELGAGGQIVNAGTLHVGGARTIGQTRLVGNLEQKPSGQLIVDTNHASGASDLLAVQGSVRLAGMVTVQPTVLANRPATVLTATDGVSLDPGLTTSRTYLYNFSTVAAGNTVQVRPSAEFGAAAASLGDNQRNVAAHLQDIWGAGTTFDTGFTALASIADSRSYARALDSLSGQTLGSVGASRYIMSEIFAENTFNECPTFDAAGRSMAEASCVWLRAFGSSIRQDSTSDALGYGVSSWNFQAGGQAQVAPGLFLGAALGYETSLFRGENGTSRINGDTLLGNGSLRYQVGPWQFTGLVDFGLGFYDSRRSVAAGTYAATASASPDTWMLGGHTRVAYRQPFGGWYLQPQLDMHLVYVNSSSYTETGAAPFNLAVQSTHDARFAAIPALEVGGRVPLQEGAVLRPYLSAGLKLATGGDWHTTARFDDSTGVQPFRVRTPIPDVMGRFTVGAQLVSAANWDLKLQYSLELGDGFTAHAGMARLAYRF